VLPAGGGAVGDVGRQRRAVVHRAEAHARVRGERADDAAGGLPLVARGGPELGQRPGDVAGHHLDAGGRVPQCRDGAGEHRPRTGRRVATVEVEPDVVADRSGQIADVG